MKAASPVKNLAALNLLAFAGSFYHRRLSAMRKLKEEEVRNRLEGYSNNGVTDELYDFGKTLVADIVERHNRLETKAATMAAYSIGVITLLASTFANWVNRGISVGVLITVVAAFTAIVFSVLSLKLERFEGISQTDWFQNTAFDDRETLRKFHVLTMWGVFASHEAVNERKASRIAVAQVALFVAAISLVASLVYAIAVL
jgi:hypothetical protein